MYYMKTTIKKNNGLVIAMARLFFASLFIVGALGSCNDNDDNTANDNIEDIEPSPKELSHSSAPINRKQ